jgi:hypothetical protein
VSRWKPQTEAERFWSKVKRSDGCWLWLDALDRKGYGVFGINRRGRWLPRRTHRVAWELTNGPTDAPALLHECDNPRCVRPDHLKPGTIADNNADMRRKKRHAHGSRHHWSKLTDEDVDLIRCAYETLPVTQEQLAVAFGVYQRTISRLVNQESRPCA